MLPFFKVSIHDCIVLNLFMSSLHLLDSNMSFCTVTLISGKYVFLYSYPYIGQICLLVQLPLYRANMSSVKRPYVREIEKVKIVLSKNKAKV